MLEGIFQGRLFSRLTALSAALAVTSVFTAPAAVASVADFVTIEYDLSEPVDDLGNPIGFDGSPTFYRLTGQSAYFQSRTNSSTSGNQLDGAVGFGGVGFYEVFPEPQHEDYLTYSYIGVIELVGTDTGGNEVILDQSIVIGYNSSAESNYLGFKLEDNYAYDKPTLVNAFTNEFDSPEFLDMAFNVVGGQSDTSADLGLTTTELDVITQIATNTGQPRFVQDLTLVAYLGGNDADLGISVGRIFSTVVRETQVPEPGTAALALAGLAAVTLRRRSA